MAEGLRGKKNTILKDRNRYGKWSGLSKKSETHEFLTSLCVL